MDFKLHIRSNFIIYIYLVFQLFILFFSFQKDKIIEDGYEFSLGMTYHIFSFLSVLFGYMPKNPNFIESSNFEKKNIIFDNKFIIIAYCLTIFGLITSIATIGAIISPTEYLNVLFSGGGDINSIKAESGGGGLGGIFKMFNYAPVCVFMVTTALKCFYKISEDQVSKVTKIQNIALIASLLKVFFSLDRLTILAILVGVLYEKVLLKKINLKLLILIPLFGIVLTFITSSRMSDSSPLDFLATYSKLSLINFDLVIKNETDWSLGWNTFLSPLSFILKFFGYEKMISEPKVWVWNPAQYFNSSLYMDFGLFSFFIQFLIGYIIRRIQIQANRGALFFASIYLVISFAVCTFYSVPIIRAIEFWLMISIAFVLKKFVKIVN